MRIVEVVRGLGIGGIEVSLRRRLRSRPPDAWTAVISTYPSLDTLSEEIALHSDTLIEVGTKRWNSAALLSQVRQLQPDIVVSHIPLETLKILVSALPREFPVAVVAHYPRSSEYFWVDKLMGSALKQVNHKAALHFAVSTAVAEGNQCRGARRVKVLPLGATLTESVPDFSLWPVDCGVRMLSLGRLRAFKNLDSLLRGVALIAVTMRTHKAFLAVVGDGVESERLKTMIRRHGLSDVVALYPARPEPSGVLRASDVFITVSQAEGGPVTAMEALLAGCRLVMTRTGLYSDLTEHHSQVSPVDDGRPEAIAHALEQAVLEGSVGAQERAINSRSAERWSSSLSNQTYYATLRSLLTTEQNGDQTE